MSSRDLSTFFSPRRPAARRDCRELRAAKCGFSLRRGLERPWPAGVDCSLRRARSASRSKPGLEAVRGSERSVGSGDESVTGSANYVLVRRFTTFHLELACRDAALSRPLRGRDGLRLSRTIRGDRSRFRAPLRLAPPPSSQINGREAAASAASTYRRSACNVTRGRTCKRCGLAVQTDAGQARTS
jgi:hypothetical protein